MNLKRRSAEFLPVAIGVVANVGKHPFILTVAAQLVPVFVSRKLRGVRPSKSIILRACWLARRN